MKQFYFIYFFVRGKYLLPLKMLTFLIEDWTRGIFFAKTSQNTGFSERLMFLSLKEQKLFCFDFISVFRKQNICQPDSPLRLVRSKSWNILENLEGVSKVSVQTCLWAVLTLFEIMNQWMILSWRPWRVMKKKLWNQCQFLALNSPNCADSCQGQIKIPPNPRQDPSTLKCNLILSLDLNSAGNSSLLSSNAFKKHQRHQNIQSGQIQLVQQNTFF